MSQYWHEVLNRQCAAAIEMLRNAVEACPDDLWDDRTDGTPVWHIAYHALFFCDLYLSDNLESFQAPDFHVDRYHFLPGDYKEFGGIVTTPDRSYSRQQMLEYADHCIEKSRAVFAELTEERARERCGFWWYELNVGEFLINNLRHTQHHAAQLALILRRRAGVGVEWLGTEHNQPPPPTWQTDD
jgi:hypothetical protein